MRTLAWCGMSQVDRIQRSRRPLSQTARAERSSTVTACLNTAWPSMRRKGVADDLAVRHIAGGAQDFRLAAVGMQLRRQYARL